jgi:hypothetical protein
VCTSVIILDDEDDEMLYYEEESTKTLTNGYDSDVHHIETDSYSSYFADQDIAYNYTSQIVDDSKMQEEEIHSLFL